MTDRTSNGPRRNELQRLPAQIWTGPKKRSRPIGELHKVDELAERWRISRRTLQRAIKSGALRVHRIGRLVRISDADAAAFLNENRDD